jgi:hypothetical protein
LHYKLISCSPGVKVCEEFDGQEFFGLLTVRDSLAEFEWYSQSHNMTGVVLLSSNSLPIDLNLIRVICRELAYERDVEPETPDIDAVRKSFKIID